MIRAVCALLGAIPADQLLAEMGAVEKAGEQRCAVYGGLLKARLQPFYLWKEHAQLAKLRSDEFATAQGYLTELLGGAKALFSSHVRNKPGDRDAAQKALNDVRLLKATPRQLQTDALHDTLDQIIADFRRSDDGQTEPSQKLTSEMTQKIVSDLKEQLGDSKSLHDVTPEMMTDAVSHALAPLNLPEKVENRLRVLMLSMFTKPGDSAKPEEPSQTDEE